MQRADTPTELDEERIRHVLPKCAPKAKLLIELGFESGLRLSELLGLRVTDVWRDGVPARFLRMQRRRLKGGAGVRGAAVGGRTIPLNARARVALEEYFAGLAEPFASGDLVFPSGGRNPALPMSRQHGRRIIRKIFLAAGLDPERVWSGHSLRKRFCRRIYDQTKDLNVVRQAVGHRWITTSQLYLGLDEEAAQAAILQLGESSSAAPVVSVAAAINKDEPSLVSTERNVCMRAASSGPASLTQR